MRWISLLPVVVLIGCNSDDTGECGGTRCDAGQICVVSECRALCNTSHDCAASSDCIDGICVPLCPSGSAGEPCSIRRRNDGRCVDIVDGVVCRLLAGADCELDGDCLDGNCECADNDCTAQACHTSGCGACQYVVGDSCSNTPVGNRGEDCNEAGWQCDANQACKVDDGSTCAADEDCVSQHCECVDAACSGKACSAAVCDCRFNSDGDGTCDGDIAGGLDDANDTCGIGLTCDGSGGCHAEQGDSCVTENECESGFCADGFCCNNACAGDCDSCDESGYEGACRAIVGDCAGDCAACAAHAGGFSCAADPGQCLTLCTSCVAGAGELNCAFDANQSATDCAATEICVAAGSCLIADGEACTPASDGDCASGVCSSAGYCCDADGPCIVAIDAAEDFTCAIHDGGDVSCWGYNGQWQLGAGTPTYTSTPIAITGLSQPAVDLAVGGSAVCAALADGTVECWGYDSSGVFGDGNTVVNPPGAFAVATGLSGVTEVVAGSAHMCALHGGAVSCWGNNLEGQVGHGTSGMPVYSPVPVPGITTAMALDAGRMQTCAVLEGGSARCWGTNLAGQLGDGTTSSRSNPVAVQDVTTAVDISTGSRHSCAVLDDGTVSCWGANPYGQLGGAPGDASAVPVPVAGISNVAKVLAGWEHTCVLRIDGGVTCWGSNVRGTLGNGAVAEWGVASPLPPAAVTAVGSPGRHTCAALRDGNVSCWGANVFGDVGDGSVVHTSTPATVSGLGTVLHMDGGRTHTAAVLPDGTVRTWGYNNGGCLGDDTEFTRFAPVTALGVTNAIQVAAGGDFTCALSNDQSVVCWGFNWLGQLGDGTTEEHRVATPAALPATAQIAAGRDHACARLADGTVSCWGANMYGQLGDGTTDMMRPNPEVVPGLTAIRDVSTGSQHTCVIDGPETGLQSVWCWGHNSNYQLGPGGSSSDPVLVMSLPDLRDLEANANANCVVDRDRQTWCWGANYLGQLGNGDQLDSSSAVAVSNLPADVERLAGFGDFMCALTLSDTVYCWGNNLLGQVGTESTGVESRAVQLSGLTGVTSLAAGNDHACASTTTGTSCWGHGGAGQLGDGVETHALSPVTVTGW